MSETADWKSDAGGGQTRGRIVDAFMRLLERRSFRDIQYADIADEAGMSLADVRAAFSGRATILADFARRIEEAVLADGPAEGESPRDRLFDVMMRRFDALRPYRAALRRLAETARRDPFLAASLMRHEVRTQRWLLAAAGLRPAGPEGEVAVHGAALVFAEAARVWLRDDDTDEAETMAALDGALRRGDRVMDAVSRIARVLRPLSVRDKAETV